MADSDSKSKIMLYIIVGIIIVFSFIGMVSSSVAASEVGTSTESKAPAVLSAVTNSLIIILGAGLFYAIHKDGEDS